MFFSFQVFCRIFLALLFFRFLGKKDTVSKPRYFENKMFKGIAFLFLTFCSTLGAGLLPDYDRNCASMYCFPATIESTDYFNQPVPKKIHQIWFGDPRRVDQRKIGQWKEYAEKFGFTYTLWSEADDATLQSFMLPRNYELMIDFRNHGNYWAASDILRCELIKTFGGIYIDCDFLPPTNKDSFVNFEDILTFKGLTLMTEHFGRDIGSKTALFAANGFIVCSENHPVICSVVEQVYDNTKHWQEKNYRSHNCGEAVYCTGPFLLNKVLSGCFNIVPCVFLEKHHMDDTNPQP